MSSSRIEQKDQAILRLLQYALAKAPEEFALIPDKDGWISLKELIKAFHEDPQLRYVRESIVREITGRLAQDTLLINNNQIRSVVSDAPQPVYDATPPAHLYYGVRRKGYAVIREQGLTSPPGSHLMLCTHKEKALMLGKRRDQEPVLVTVQARQAAEQGVLFAAWGDGVFVCDWVPAACLFGPPASLDLPEKKPAQPKKSAPEPDPMPGSFLISLEDGEKPYKRKGLKKDIAWKKDRRQKERWNPKGS